MTGRRPIDLGPMYMPLGDEPERRLLVEAQPGAARPGDVERFRAAMKDEPQQLHSPGLPGPISLLSRESVGHPADHAAPDAQQRTPTDDEQQPGFVEAIERLWVGEGLHSEREVRIGIRNDILPETAVRMRMSQGAIHVDLTCAEMPTAKWLAGQLEFLVSTLGSRLGGAVVATVEHVDRGVLRTVAWYPGRR